MRKFFTTATIGATAILALTAATPAWSANTTAISEVAPILATAQTASDLPPAVVDLGALGGIDADTVRSLGSDEIASYWIGQTSNSDICLITHIRGGNEVASSSCRTIPEFNLMGLGLITGEGTDDPSRSAEAYYLPSDISLSEIGAPVQAEVSGRASTDGAFTSGRPGSLDLDEADVKRADGSTFRFQPLSLPGEKAAS